MAATGGRGPRRVMEGRSSIWKFSRDSQTSRRLISEKRPSSVHPKVRLWWEGTLTLHNSQIKI